MLRVITWNLLAPMWVECRGRYNSGESCTLLKPKARKSLWVQHISMTRADVYCLQEVQVSGFQTMMEHLPDYVSCYVPHDRGHWAHDLGHGHSWKSNGNAILLRKSRFHSYSFISYALGGGNNMTVVTAVWNGRHVEIMNVHLEDTNKSLQHKQMDRIRRYIRRNESRYIARNTLVILSGDFNHVMSSIDLTGLTQDGRIQFQGLHRYPTFLEVDPVAIDYTFVHGSSRLKTVVPMNRVDADLVSVFGSDHLPVRTDIEA